MACRLVPGQRGILHRAPFTPSLSLDFLLCKVWVTGWLGAEPCPTCVSSASTSGLGTLLLSCLPGTQGWQWKAAQTQGRLHSVNHRPQKRYPLSTLSVKWGHDVSVPGISQEAVSWPSAGTTAEAGLEAGPALPPALVRPPPPLAFLSLPHPTPPGLSKPLWISVGSGKNTKRHCLGSKPWRSLSGREVGTPTPKAGSPHPLERGERAP